MRAEVTIEVGLVNNPLLSGLLAEDIGLKIERWATKHLDYIEDSFVEVSFDEPRSVPTAICRFDVDSIEKEELKAAIKALKELTKQQHIPATAHYQVGFQDDMYC